MKMSRDFRHDTEAEPNMCSTSPVTHLDEKALEAALHDYQEEAGRNAVKSGLEAAIRAYLSALPSSPVSELVDVTQPIDDIYVRDGFCDWADVANARDEVRNLHDTALTTLTTLTTRNAELEREVKRLREALERIDGLEVMEINPSNYSHEDVCELNNNAIQAALIANAALYRPALSTSPQGGEHE